MSYIDKIKKYGVEYDIHDTRADYNNLVGTVNQAINNGDINVDADYNNLVDTVNQAINNGDINIGDEDIFDATSIIWPEGTLTFRITENQAAEILKHDIIRIFDDIYYMDYSDSSSKRYSSIGGRDNTSYVIWSSGICSRDYYLYVTQKIYIGNWKTLTTTQQTDQYILWSSIEQGPGLYLIELAENAIYGNVYTATLSMSVNNQTNCCKTFKSTPIYANNVSCLKLIPEINGDLVTNRHLSWADIQFPANIEKYRVTKLRDYDEYNV